MSFSHRPSNLKQSNKKFKSKHATKSKIRDMSKGRTLEERLTRNGRTLNAKLAQDKAVNRRNKAKQVRQNKNDALVEQARLFSGRRGADRVARVVTVLPLTADVSAETLVSQLVGETEMSWDGRVRTFSAVKNHNQLLKFVVLPPASDRTAFYETLDLCMASDFLILGFSAETEVDYQAETLLRALIGMGVGSAAGSVLGTLAGPATTPVKTSLLSYITHFIPSIERILSLDNGNESKLALRHLCEKTPRRIRWRDARGRVVADRIDYDEQERTLAVEGVVRGSAVDVNRLVHLCGFGDYRLSRIKVVRPQPHGQSAMEVDSETILLRDNDDADDLQSTNVPDDLENEQTWPTEEELANGATRHGPLQGDRIPDALPGTTPNLRKVPKGTSAYQAAWLESEDEDSEGDDDSDRSDVMEQDGFVDLDALAEEAPDYDLSEEEQEVIDLNEKSRGVDLDAVDLDAEAMDNAEYKQYLSNRQRDREEEDEDDAAFPDEVDTPEDIPARERFARYRGLQSFRTSAWDPYENLPVDYSKCFMFEDFNHIGKRLERNGQAAEANKVPEGTRVILYVEDVDRAVYEHKTAPGAAPLIVYSLFLHEHKQTVMHMSVTRNTEFTTPVRSKDECIVQVGFRRFVINPIFSQHTIQNNGKGANNVHKMEKYLRHSVKSHIASAYLPLTFGSSGVLLLKDIADDEEAENEEDADSKSRGIKLVASGSIFTADPTRIIAKRIILTGSVFKVHRRTATIRYMFFNDDDVAYYKPVQLRTKRGRVGNIKESLGTHGYFKAIFDGQIDQMDVICMCLYKRCFPKWSKPFTLTGGKVESMDID